MSHLSGTRIRTSQNTLHEVGGEFVTIKSSESTQSSYDLFPFTKGECSYYVKKSLNAVARKFVQHSFCCKCQFVC